MKLGLILKYLDEEYQAAVYRGVRDEAARAGFSVTVIQGGLLDSLDNPDGPIFPAPSFLALDGILILSSIIVDHCVPFLGDRLGRIFASLPTVCVGTAIDGFPSVTVDVRKAIDALVAHLLDDHGYRRGLYIGGPASNLDNMLREQAIREAFNHGFRRGSGCELLVMNGDLFSENVGLNLIREYVVAHPDRDIDVILAGSDDMAAGIRKYLRSCPYLSWQDCPLTGFDDTPRSGASGMDLTTVSQNLGELGAAAVGLLVDVVRGDRSEDNRKVFASLRVRSSCGCQSIITGADTASFPTAGFREERFRDLGYLGQELMAIRRVEEIERSLTEFLVGSAVSEFRVILFSGTDFEVPESGWLLYEFSGGTGVIHPEPGVPVGHDGALLALDEDRRGTNTRCLLHLKAGDERLGLILYAGPDKVHAYMSGCGLFLAQTIKRLRLLESEKRRQEELETEVRRRTEAFEREAERRMRVEEEVLVISDLERMRFSIDLHDDVCQRLAAIHLICQSYGETDERMAMIGDMAAETLQRTRRYAQDSFPVELESIDLRSALSRLCEDLDGTGGCRCDFDCPEGIDADFNPKQKINVYRIVQEALNNAFRHSGATVVRVSLTPSDNGITVLVDDDGKGRPTPEAKAVSGTSERRPRGLGLRSMEYRSHQLNADFSLVSSPDSGTSVRVVIPAQRRET